MAGRQCIVFSVVVSALLALSACGSGAIPEPDGPVQIERSMVGFSPGAGIAWQPEGAADDDLAAMGLVGAGWVRLDIDWSNIEREPDTYDWADTDRLIDAAQRGGLEVLGLLAYTPAWARPPGGSDKTPPIDDGDFARFAAAAASRYRDRGVTTWEIWNEPNTDLFWQPQPDPEHYARLLDTTVEALRAVDPDLTILSGGLAPARDEPSGDAISPRTYLERLIDTGALADVDGFAIHPYSFPARPLDPSTSRWNTFLALPDVHRRLIESDAGPREVWITEYGAPTGEHDRSLSESQQARLIVDALWAADRWPWTGPVFVYAYRDYRLDPADLEWNYGVVNNDGSPKQAWHDIRAAVID